VHCVNTFAGASVDISKTQTKRVIDISANTASALAISLVNAAVGVVYTSIELARLVGLALNGAWLARVKNFNCNNYNSRDCSIYCHGYF
jgi:hypothetical protein